MKTGSIPKQVKLFCRPKASIVFRMEDISVEDFQKVTEGKSVFVADATNEKTCKTGLSWLCSSGRAYDYKLKRYADNTAEPDIVELENKPFGDVRLISLEYRGNGGRAYKVLILDEYIFDLREDVLLDSILNDGVLKNGVLPGKYLFASVGSEMKLIREGSLLCDKMQEATAFNTKKKITKLIPGHVYQNKVETLMYLGKIPTKELALEYYDTMYSRYQYGHNRDEFKSAKITDRKEQHFFINVQDGKLPKTLNDITEGYRSVVVRDKTPKSFRNDLGKTNLELADIFEAIRAEGERRATSYSWAGGTKYQRISRLEYYDHMLNLSTEPDFIHPLIIETISS